MPDALLPTRPDGSMWYGPEALRIFRLSSKSHWDVPVTIGSQELHLLVSHPTPPAFDGPEDRNGKRNHDEIRIWADYLTGGPRADYLRKALPAGSSITPPETFVILGDLNSDPHDGGSVANAVGQLLRHPRVNPEPIPTSEGAAEASKLQGGRNAEHRGDPAQDTADFADSSVGNLRADYVLPSRNLVVLGSGVFWPRSDDPLARLVAMTPAVATSDHRLVYIDVRRP
ncbi:MAG: endonuclease/exonuclease/phosphatase family protein [Isosphaeraceae bacterium]